jgi:hypothetical protein
MKNDSNAITDFQLLYDAKRNCAELTSEQSPKTKRKYWPLYLMIVVIWLMILYLSCVLYDALTYR